MQQTGVRKAPRTRIVSLDIGTYACGFATAAIRDGKLISPVVEHNLWPDQPQPYPKARSALLYRRRTPIAWGYTARKQLLQLSATEQADHWYVEDFKLALRDEERAADIRAKGLTPEQVMADYLTLFTAYVKERLHLSHGVQLSELDQIQWCLTVPAMWSEANKSAMRRAALKAGLISTADSDALTIILEPEAAALHAMETKAPPLTPGMTVCMLDVGGGTADITIHNVTQRNNCTVLAEAVAAHGELCGSVYVDEAFRKHYRSVVGPAAFDSWSASYPAELQQVLDKWTVAKHQYGTQTLTTGPSHLAPKVQAVDSSEEAGYRMPIPPHLISQVQSQQLRKEGSVLLTPSIMQSLFEGPVSKVVDAAVHQLTQLGTSCSLVLIVGGFAASPFLQQRVKVALLGEGLAAKVHVPPTPYAAVLKGAVLYGCVPSLIHARRCRMAYGIRVADEWHFTAPSSSLFFHKEKQVHYTDAVFKRFVNKDELVEHDAVITHTVYPLYTDQTCVLIDLVATDNKQLKYVDKSDSFTRTIGSVTVRMAGQGRDRPIHVQFKFGATEIQVTAWDVALQQKVAIEVKFAHHHA